VRKFYVTLERFMFGAKNRNWMWRPLVGVAFCIVQFEKCRRKNAKHVRLPSDRRPAL